MSSVTSDPRVKSSDLRVTSDPPQKIDENGFPHPTKAQAETEQLPEGQFKEASLRLVTCIKVRGKSNSCGYTFLILLKKINIIIIIIYLKLLLELYSYSRMYYYKGILRCYY